MNGVCTDAGGWPRSVWFSICKTLRLAVNDSTLCVKPLMEARASCSCCSKDTMTGGDDGGEEGVDMSEKLGEVWRYREKAFHDDILSQRRCCVSIVPWSGCTTPMWTLGLKESETKTKECSVLGN